MKWIHEEGPLGDVVLSSRIRLARNLADVPFPSRMDENMAEAVIQRVRASVLGDASPVKEEYQFLAMKDFSPKDRQIIVEKHLASPDLMERPERAALLVDSSEQISIMINEEDHIRMQCICPGYQLEKAWESLNKIDDIIEAQLPYSYDEKLGYLTCCPTNVGTGMRASIMMHLPGLVITGNMNSILQAISKIGLTVRGLYGEGSEAMGNIYQISNQVTLGVSEEEIVSNLKAIGQQIIEKERMARKALIENGGVRFEDNVLRAFGILKHARILDIKEFMNLISQVRIGVDMGLITGLKAKDITEIMILGQPAHLTKYAEGELPSKDLDIMRAKMVREKLSNFMG